MNLLDRQIERGRASNRAIARSRSRSVTMPASAALTPAGRGIGRRHIERRISSRRISSRERVAGSTRRIRRTPAASASRRGLRWRYGVTVDPVQQCAPCRCAPGPRRRRPSRRDCRSSTIGERAAGPFGFGEGPDAVVAQLRQQRQKHPRRGGGVAERGMSVGRQSTPSQAASSSSELPARFGDRSAPDAAYRACAAAATAGRQAAFLLQDRQVEADGVPDHHGLTEIIRGSPARHPRTAATARPWRRRCRGSRVEKAGIGSAPDDVTLERAVGPRAFRRTAAPPAARAPAPCADRDRWSRYRSRPRRATISGVRIGPVHRALPRPAAAARIMPQRPRAIRVAIAPASMRRDQFVLDLEEAEAA